MMSNVVELRPPAAPAAVEQAEPIEAAVLELSARIAENNAERRRLFARLDELRGLTPSLRRRRARSLPLAPPEPVTFAIEETAASAPAPRRAARGGR
ncbi:MAG: hypothetical protein QOH49_604 [Acidobacteriota bacterium]|nr:hypothetical protein [Acidobacteriota bacterium]